MDVSFHTVDRWLYVTTPSAELIAGDLGAAFKHQNENIAIVYDLPVVPDGPIFRIASLSATPVRQGHGREVLSAFLRLADRARAWVVLELATTPSSTPLIGLLQFYGRHGFLVTQNKTMFRRPGCDEGLDVEGLPSWPPVSV